ncbi:MAG: SRPBCC domain-containing protein [Actinomycetota bacterium]
MGHPFEIDKQIEVPATPEQAWDAITTGPEIDSWFMGRNEVEPREGGTARTSFPGWTLETTVTAWDPPTRFATRSDEGQDGSFHSFDYRVEPRAEGGTTIRWLHSGFIGGDHWEAEYEAMGEGDPMYLHKLAQYLTYFVGRTATPIDVVGPQIPDPDETWTVFRRGLGLSGPVVVDEEVHLAPEGLPPLEGVVDYVSPSFLGVRTDDGLYRFIASFDGSSMVGHHIFSADIDQQQTEKTWRIWLDRLFG